MVEEGCRVGIGDRGVVQCVQYQYRTRYVLFRPSSVLSLDVGQSVELTCMRESVSNLVFKTRLRKALRTPGMGLNGARTGMNPASLYVSSSDGILEKGATRMRARGIVPSTRWIRTRTSGRWRMDEPSDASDAARAVATPVPRDCPMMPTDDGRAPFVRTT